VQNSGGLLPGVPRSHIDDFFSIAREKDIPAWWIGEVINEDKIIVES